MFPREEKSHRHYASGPPCLAFFSEPALLSSGPHGYLIPSYKLSYPSSSVPHSAEFAPSFPFNWSPSSHCDMHIFVPSSFLPPYYLLPGSCSMIFETKTFFSFLSASLCCFFLFFEVKSVAQAISKLDIARDGLKLLILLLLSEGWDLKRALPHLVSKLFLTVSLNTTRTTWDGLVPAVTFKSTWWLQQSINDQGQGEECRPHWNYKSSFRKKNLTLLDFTG